jgi:hypothetical protein
MHASNVALLVLATPAAAPVLAAPISYVVASSTVVDPAELCLSSVRNATDASSIANPPLLFDSRSQDSGVSLSGFQNDTVLENKRGELGPLPGSSPQKAPAYDCSDDSLRRDLSSIDDTLKQLAARGVLDNLSNGGALNARGFDSHQEINSDPLAARNIAGDVGEFVVESAEAVDNRTHQRIQARGVPEVRTETAARDVVADDFVAALLKSRVSDIIPEDLLSSVSLASRAYHDLD